MKFISFKLFVLAIFCTALFSSQSFAKELKMAISLSLPPYIIKTDNVTKGIEYDIVKEALKSFGYNINARFVSFGDLSNPKLLKRVDGVLTINENSGLSNIHYSDFHITYQNVVVTLKKKGLKIDSIADLGGKRVLAFQNAVKYLGPDFKAMSSKNRQYREIADQESQVARLFVGKTDAFVGEINIFKYFRQNTSKVNTKAEVVYHEIFTPTQYKVGFVDSKIRDEFNKGLNQLKKSGQYAKIHARYVK